MTDRERITVLEREVENLKRIVFSHRDAWGQPAPRFTLYDAIRETTPTEAKCSQALP